MAMIYPIGEQDFAGIRERGLVYVDKTDLVYKMTQESKYYFLARPRRFGKSLLLSTLENYFRGNKEAFHGLAMEHLEKEWKRHPVLTLNFGKGEYATLDDLTNRLRSTLSGFEKSYGRNEEEQGYGERFTGVIQRAYEQTGEKVVILIDEYDAPFQAALDKPEMMVQYQSTLRDIYLCLKNNDKYIRFAFLTGITVWGKVGVFSTLNNLKDITFLTEYATLCGITEAELHHVFHEEVVALAEENELTVEEAYQKLKMQYDGYHFARKSPEVYNPFSLLRALDDRTFENYWIETGRTRTITTLVQHKQIDISMLMNELTATPDSLRNIENFNEDIIPYLYQAGYLTIKGYDSARQAYTLQIPNTEVRESLGFHLIASTFGFEKDKSLQFRGDLRVAIYYGDIPKMVELINTFVFYPGHHRAMGDKEVYCQTNLATLFRLIGYEVEVEKGTAKGSADMVVKTDRLIYVIETKLNGNAQDALAQINEKGYADPYRSDLRKIVKLGLNFSEEERILDDYAFEM